MIAVEPAEVQLDTAAVPVAEGHVEAAHKPLTSGPDYPVTGVPVAQVSAPAKGMAAYEQV